MEDVRPFREIELEWITLSDSTRLAARMWLPEGAEREPVPALLEYVPYRRRDSYRERDNFTQPYFAERGYACLRVDIRGTGDSEGLLRDEYLKQEQDDGLEVIDWIARQPWCTGKIGMLGNSWGGFNSLQLAARRPKALKAIITSCSTDDRYADDMHYMGGCLINDNMQWGTNFFARMARGPDPLMVGHDRWRAMWRERLEAWYPPFITWTRHQARDAYWKQGSVCEDYGAIECAVFAVGGWADGYSNAIFRMLANLKCPRIGVVGAWGHAFPHRGAPGPGIDFLREAMRWWDHWLKGQDTGIMNEPMLRAWVQESVPPAGTYTHRPGYWAGELSWPSPIVGLTAYALGANTLCATRHSAPPSASDLALSVRSPQHVGQYASEWSGFGNPSFPDLPLDQREEDGGSLVFETEPLSAPITILGAPEVDLDLVADQATAFVAARLNDVRADGSILRVTYGVLNLTHRDGHEHPKALEPGRRYRIRVKLNEIGHVFPAGHRIRLSLSTAYWPLCWPSPRPVRLTVHCAGSRLTLPFRERQGDDDRIRFDPPVLARTTATTMLRRPAFSKAVSRDIATGEVVVHDMQDEGIKRLEDIATDLEVVKETTARVKPDDPTSARLELFQRFANRRGKDWDMSAEATCSLSCTETEFLAEATLRVSDGGKPFFVKTWFERIPRDGV